MELATLVLFALAFLTFRLSRYFLSSKSRLDLPGPSFLTVLLNFRLFGTIHFHKLLAQWSKKYGNIFTFNLFGKRFVVVATPELMKTAFSVEERTSNLPGNAFEVYNGGNYGIGPSKEKQWVEQRKFAVQNLKHYGFRGVGSSNEQLTKDLDDIIQLIAKQCAKPIDAAALQLPTLNMMWRVTTSTTLSQEQIPLLRRFQKCFSTYLFSKKQNALGPLLANFGLETDLAKRYKVVSAEFRQVQKEIIDEHVRGLEEKTEPDDFVDSYLLKMRDEKSRGSSFEGQLGMRNLSGSLMDMNIAGSNTVSHTFQSILLHMIVHPESQAKLREQVDAVLGPTRTPVLEDRKNLPYVEAFILEVLRDFSPAPFSFHESTQDSKLDGHFIPKDTTIVGNIWHANHHEELWEEPMSFKPERFLDSSGEKVEKADLVMSFSAGRHKCPGYLIGQDILFLLTTRIAQRFILMEHPEHPITSLEPGMEFFLTAPDFKILFLDRLNTA